MLEVVTPRAIVVGGGPAGLMAADVLLDRGVAVDLYDAMPSLGRKFLMAGKSGLNLTHAEPLETFLTRFGAGRDWLESSLRNFDNAAVRDWAAGLGVETFVGSSGRVFPTEMKAAPLLRRWLARLRDRGLRIHVRHRWTGWGADGGLIFDTPSGPVTVSAPATVLALGGASWPQLGSDGAWAGWMRNRVALSPFRPANAGFDVAWTPHFVERFAGEPVKSVVLKDGATARPGEFVVTETGIEGSAVYAFSASLRDQVDRTGSAQLTLDLTPDRGEERLVQALSKDRGKQSLSSHLRKATGLKGVKAGLLRECLSPDVFQDPVRLGAAIKAVPLRLIRSRPLEEAISSAGGVRWDAVTGTTQLAAMPGTFAAGEMLDWEAPTGGYLLTACFALGRRAGEEAADFLGTASR
ncbi:TIGR03862 family flavoprotein [Rhodospirillaceae bacterium KN72]|uniref:TIGR03862 family flavoprotein n=1 Tax=Pacificispira spongiicola TaxID=2729598 RepID=A0A7Y0HH00_9PROT|nr:TIGR03862 family flavoprotein [Pacificispira spongiicola]NMM45442.1 TIGR03862 family flavoprotein [Pacificispira spongiicola]